ncbi:hypothetical protein BY996DRAFT_7272685, partial [Phakopsora pachyrhizi]
MPVRIEIELLKLNQLSPMESFRNNTLLLPYLICILSNEFGYGTKKLSVSVSCFLAFFPSFFLSSFFFDNKSKTEI